MPLPALIAERFELYAEAATGGMGTVYRANDLLTREQVAVKLLRIPQRDDIERFRREANVLAQLSVPGIVRYIDHGTCDFGPYLVMEWVEGETMANRLSRRGFTAHESVSLVHRLAEILAEVHARSLVHRDLKPSNVIFPDEGWERLVLIDFGVARRQSESSGVTRTGMMVGTPGYMAPEQARGVRELDARADVFALGCLLYECLSGRPAFPGRHMVATCSKILLSEPTPLAKLIPEIPLELDDLVKRMLAKDPAGRPAGGAEVAAALAAIPEVPNVLRRPSKHSDAPTSRQSRKTPLSVGASFAVLATVPEEEVTRVEAPLHEAIKPFGADLVFLADGSLVVTLPQCGSPVDEAAQAARCAMAMRQIIPEAPMVVASDWTADGSVRDTIFDVGAETLASEGYQQLFGEHVTGEAVLRGAIRVDEAAVPLLAGFDLIQREAGHYLLTSSLGGPHR